MFDFTDQVVLVTGGGNGIGAATCRIIASLGGTVIVTDAREDSAKGVATEILDAGGKATSVSLDVVDFDACNVVIDAVVAEHGRLDALITCAGWCETHALLTEEPSYWKSVVDVNYMGTINPCFAAMRHMKPAGKGRIVTFSSDAARVGTWGEAVYAGAKAGVIGFTKSIARELAKSGIVANVVSPGVTDTQLMRHQDQVIIDKMVNLVPIKRLGRPEEVAAAAVFLATPAVSFITGQVISVSGGLTMVD
jgi:2-hydroxycyclohexanecarboxyl-CoA dehydrogenase